MINQKEISNWDSKDIVQWLQLINMDEYISKFESNKINGYDLIYLNNEDLNSLGIVNVHDKNILLKSLKKLLLENLKLTLNFEGKTLTIQLEFDPYYTVGQLTTELKNIFQTSSNIFIITNSNEILMSNLKIIDLILFNTYTYKNFKIVTGEQLSKLKNVEPINNYFDDSNLLASKLQTINNNTEKTRNYFLNDYHKSNKVNNVNNVSKAENNITDKSNSIFTSKISNKKRFHKINESSKSCCYSQNALKINDKFLTSTKDNKVNEDDLLIKKAVSNTNFNETYSNTMTKNKPIKNIKYNSQRKSFDNTSNEDIKLKCNKDGEYNFHYQNNDYFNTINKRNKISNNILFNNSKGNKNERMKQDYQIQ